MTNVKPKISATVSHVYAIQQKIIYRLFFPANTGRSLRDLGKLYSNDRKAVQAFFSQKRGFKGIEEYLDFKGDKRYYVIQVIQLSSSAPVTEELEKLWT